MAMQKIVLASNNPGKLREFASLFEPLGIELIPQGMLGVSEAEEPHVTFIENALAKARHASAATGLPALADDSGLCVPILGGAPGVYSARYAARAGREKSDAANNRHLIEQLAPHADTPGYRDAYYFDSQLKIEHDLQQPFNPTHENMRQLKLQQDLPKHILVANLRRAFSGIVAGNVKDAGIRAIEKHGKFEIQGDAAIMEGMDALLNAFVEQGRMKLTGKYEPCYRLVVEPDATSMSPK